MSDAATPKSKPEGGDGSADEARRGRRPRRRRTDVLRGWRAMPATAWIVAAPIYVYRVLISPLWPHTCRFEPSCSAYALDALVEHGALRGAWLAARRVLRCHPFERLGGGSGYDPVPPRTERPAAAKGSEGGDR